MGAGFLSIRLSRVADMFRRASDLLREGHYDKADYVMRLALREASECTPYMTYLLPEKYNGKGCNDAYGGPMPGE